MYAPDRYRWPCAKVDPRPGLLSHKLRTALATIGVTVGVAAVVWVVSIGEAGTELAKQELHKLGDALVWIEAGSRNVNGVRIGNRGTTTLTPRVARDAVVDCRRCRGVCRGRRRSGLGTLPGVGRFGARPDLSAPERALIADARGRRGAVRLGSASGLPRHAPPPRQGPT